MNKYNNAKRLAIILYYEEKIRVKTISNILWRSVEQIKEWIKCKPISKSEIEEQLRKHWKNRSLRLCHIGYDAFFKPLKYKGKVYSEYCVSYDGCVFSRNKTIRWSKLKGRKNSKGYWEVCKYKSRPIILHRCIYESFTNKDVTNLSILHKDDNKNNNCMSNLYSGTHKNNGMDRVKNGLSPRGNRHGRKTITEKQAKEICEAIISEEYDYLNDLGEQFDVNIRAIYNIKRGYSFRWMFSEDELKKMKIAKGRIAKTYFSWDDV